MICPGLFNMFSEICFNEISKYEAVFLCFSFASLYVGSLYVKSQQLPRDHPEQIKARFLRVTIASAIACFIVYLASSKPKDDEHNGTFLQWIGIRKEGIVLATILPVTLLIILFLGPVVMYLLDNGFTNLTYYSPSDIMLWRNYIVAPLSEELVFRGCMLPILVPAFGQISSIFLAPWFFGIAHIHHAHELYKGGYCNSSTILISTLFQASYTTVFGMLSCYIFLRTGHLTSAVLSHSFCNMMGFPEFTQAMYHPRKYFVWTCFVGGLILFILLLGPATDPHLYNNELYSA